MAAEISPNGETPLAIKRSSISTFDYYKDNEYKLFGDCKKLEDIMKSPQLLGKGKYGKVMRYCVDKGCDIGFAVKQMHDVQEPDNPNDSFYSGLRIGYALNLFVLSGMTPHIILTLGNFECKLEAKTDAEAETRMVISTLAQGNLDSIYKSLSVPEVINVLFQIIYTLATIQSIFPQFKHNDLSLPNIFYTRHSHVPSKCFMYTISNKIFYLPDIGIRVYLADFDVAVIPGIIDNNQVPMPDPKYNVTDAYNPYYDVSYLIYGMYQDRDDLDTVLEPLLKGPPNGWNAETGRPTTNLAFKTPLELLDFDLFAPYKTLISASEVTEAFNADQQLPVLDTSHLMKRFTKCPGSDSGYMILPGSKNMVDGLIAKYCSKKTFKLTEDSTKVSQQVRGFFMQYSLSDRNIVNNYTTDEMTMDRLTQLAAYIWDYMKANIEYTGSESSIIQALCFKMVIYFSRMIIFSKLAQQIHMANLYYRQIPLTPDRFLEFFKSLSTTTASMKETNDSNI